MNNFLLRTWVGDFFFQISAEEFSLVSLFNSVSAFEGYLMPKPSLLKISFDTIQPIAEGLYNGVHIFPRGISPKENLIAGLEFEIANCDDAVQLFNPYTLRTSSTPKRGQFINNIF